MRIDPHFTQPALDDGANQWRYDQLAAEVDRLVAHLQGQGSRVLATLLDNTPAWIVADLASAQASIIHVPLPVFFTPEQIMHTLRSAGVDALLTSPPFAAKWPEAPASSVVVADETLVLLRLPFPAVQMPPGTAKVTFTSGTTGAPKGVCLGKLAMDSVADGLVEAMAPLGIERHLCALPFAVLLENIAGVMAPLRHGATCIALPLAQLGFNGSSSFDPAAFHTKVTRHAPHSIILLPQMLRVWAGFLARAGLRAPASLKLVAVGGGAVGVKLIQAARAIGIPAYEGYGLSEGASVQTLNLPGADRPGSAGRALPHARLRVSTDGEIELSGSLFNGYLGDHHSPAEWLPSGDLGEIDADGFLHINGRRKHLLITAFGRNVSPEWVETALRSEPAIAQAVVYGEAQPALSAVLWPVGPDVDDAVMQTSVAAANAALPDYARVRRWVRGRADFSAATGLATANGRPRREAIFDLHFDALLADESSQP